jgi:hypothetical protein
MKITRSTGTFAVATLLLMSAASCSPLDAMLGDTGMPSSRNTLVSGEIRSLDTRRGRIEVRDDRGRNQTVHYDNRTRVTYQQRQYPASQLQRGDQVRMQVVYDRSGTPWADRIDVRSNARASRASNRVERIDGTVGAIDARRGYFTVQRTRAPTVRVHLASRASRDDQRRFDRLRRGERVRVDVRHLDRNQAELVRFR